jgi:uncharacterized cupredoxin-like copper-binding protein
MVLFVLGAWLEHRLPDSSGTTQRSSLLQTLVLGSLLSIGLGFFTGGLQHFPDSPARSAWVVPLGFIVSVLALALSTRRAWQRSATVYVVVLGALVSAGSYGAWQWLQRNPSWAATGHSHGEAPDATSHETALQAMVVTRSIAVRMDDQMRLSPSSIAVQAGETIRFVVHNAGATAHEMVLGNEQEITAHAQAMKQATSSDAHHAHGTGAAITVAAGQTGELVVSFPVANTVEMACLIPGHYEAGMRGTITVTPTAAPGTPAPAKPAAAHDHSSHSH